MPLSDAEKLRLLNLAYNQMQADFKRIVPDLFRGDTQSLTSDASGYIFLPTNSFEVELIVRSSNNDEIEPIDKAIKYRATGWYHDGIDTATNFKKRVMLRYDGAAWASLAVKVDILIEYPELTAIDATPYPFVQQRYLNMLTELQAFMLHMEGGKESKAEAEKHWNMYQFLLGQTKKDTLDKRPHFMSHGHSDAGDGRALPMIMN